MRQTVEARESQIDAVLAEVANLRQSADELPAQLSEKARALEAEQKSLEARKADVEEKKKGRQLRKNELSKVRLAHLFNSLNSSTFYSFLGRHVLQGASRSVF